MGRRLAASLIAMSYGGNGTVTGPTISGCRYATEKRDAAGQQAPRIVLTFNKTLLRGDRVIITRTQKPIPPPPAPDPEAKHPPKWKGPTPVVDSSLMHVCTGSAADCACLSWKPNGTKHDTQGFICEIPFEGGEARPVQATRADIWAEAPATLLPGGTSVAIDTSRLNMSTGGVRAVKFAWAEKGGTCCIDAQSQRTGLCIPGSCGIMAQESLLPLNPFFALVDATTGVCKCPPPQRCDES